jgi:thiamine-monophosphate kinase
MSLTEFELIKRYFDRAKPHRADVLLGIGDDGAILRVPEGMDLVVTMDTLVAEVHFSEDYPPEDIGYKSLAVNLSDLAAMGAEPAWVTLALTLPKADETWLEGFACGFFELASQHTLRLVGGDVTRGPLSITVQAHGFVPRGSGLRRRGAQPGDAIYVTGTLGDAALALASLQEQGKLNAESRGYLVSRLHRPTVRVQAGIRLRDIASSAIDISDGLIADLGHILEASGVGAVIETAALPLSPAMLSETSRERGWRLALTGGDDYELCFTVPAGRVALLESLRGEIDCEVTCIGTIEAMPGLRCILPDGALLNPQRSGFQHF